jgi:hypothetical protein
VSAIAVIAVTTAIKSKILFITIYLVWDLSCKFTKNSLHAATFCNNLSDKPTKKPPAAVFVVGQRLMHIVGREISIP